MPTYPLGASIISGKDQIYVGTTVSNIIVVTPSTFVYHRPDGTSLYHRPDGTSIYYRP